MRYVPFHVCLQLALLFLGYCFVCYATCRLTKYFLSFNSRIEDVCHSNGILAWCCGDNEENHLIPWDDQVIRKALDLDKLRWSLALAHSHWLTMVTDLTGLEILRPHLVILHEESTLCLVYAPDMLRQCFRLSMLQFTLISNTNSLLPKKRFYCWLVLYDTYLR